MIRCILWILVGIIMVGCQKSEQFTSSGVPIITPTGNEKYLTEDSEILFHQDSFYRFDITIPERALAFIDNNPKAEQYVDASLTFRGETISPIGIRYKGSGGAFAEGLEDGGILQPASKVGTKLSMKIKIDWDHHHHTEFYGQEKVQLHAMNLDKSQMRDRLGYWLFGQMDVPAPRATHAKVYINGNYSGVYALVEQIDEAFVERHYTNHKGNLYKEVWPLTSNNKSRSISAYYKALRTNEHAGVRAQLIHQFGEELEASSDLTSLHNTIEDYMVLDEIIRYIVVDRTIRNDDGAFHWYCNNLTGLCKPHNFYWYENPSTQKVHLIPWDLDHAFENIRQQVHDITVIVNPWNEKPSSCEPFLYNDIGYKQRPAYCDKLTQGWASYTSELAQAKARFITGPFSQQSVHGQLDKWTAQIRAATEEAALLHDDAPTLSEWENGLQLLKDRADYARTN